MRVMIQSSLPKMSPEEIKEMLSPEELASVKGKTLSAYTIAESGKANPKILDEGKNRTLIWPSHVIQKIASVLKKGTKFFKWHNKDNSTEGRPSVGEVVKTFVKNLGDKVQAGFITTVEGEGLDLDICSMEADVDIDGDGIVTDLGEITGVAGANSMYEVPAFSGARRLAMIQCFGDNTNKENRQMEVTFDDVKRFVRDHSVWPHQLYSLDEMKNDREFFPVIDDYEKQIADLEKEKSDLNKNLETIESELRKLESVSLKQEAGESFKQLIDGSTDKQKAFLERRFEETVLEDYSEQGIKDFIDTTNAEFAEVAKLFSDSENGSENQNTQTEHGTADPVDAMLEEMGVK